MASDRTFDLAREALGRCLDNLEAASKQYRHAQSGRAKGAMAAVCDSMRSHIITVSADILEARKNFEFFDQLSSSVVRNAEAIAALVFKLIGAERRPQKSSAKIVKTFGPQGSRGAKRVPIPDGFSAQLQEAIEARGHGLEEACSNMGDMDPKKRLGKC